MRASAEERAALEAPASEDVSIEKALEESRELRKLESNLQIKTLEIKSFQAQRLPKINLGGAIFAAGEVQQLSELLSKVQPQ